MSLSKQEFDYIRKWARKRFAISLEDNKEYLVTSRLTPVLRRNGMNTMAELISELSKARPEAGLEGEVMDAMTTNETFFFRDIHPFDLLRDKLLPDLEAKLRSKRRLSIWSAACSSGQEIYSVAMLIREHFPQLLGWDLTLYATDLSPTVLAKAREGIYSDMEARRGLSDALRERYFKSTGGGRWQVCEAIRGMVDFKQLNFLDPWPDVGLHDVILIRNVLIYFEVEEKRKILERVRSRLSPDGLMMLGTSETTMNIDAHWEPIRGDERSTYYIPRNGG